MSSKRILLTGLSTYWGGRLAQALERDPAVEAIIGVDRRPPKVELHRTEYVRVTDSHSLIRRIVEAAEIDTVVDTRLVVDSIVTSPRLAHENNVMGTMNVLAACGGEGNPVRKVVFKSSAHYYGAEQDDPAFFTEAMDRPHAPRTPIERDIVDAERAVREFALRHPHVTVTVLRFANGLGPALRTSLSQLFGLPAVPGILGLRPALSVHPRGRPRRLPGARGAPRPRGRLQRRRRRRARPQRGGRAAGQAARARAAARGDLAGGERPAPRRRAHLARDPRPAALRPRAGQPQAQGDRLPLPLHLARGGRSSCASTSAWRPSSATPRRPTATSATSRSSCAAARACGRPPAGPSPAPSNLAPGERRGAGLGQGSAGYDDLDADELIALLPSLEPEALAELADHERAHAARPEVMKAIASLQGWEART